MVILPTLGVSVPLCTQPILAGRSVPRAPHWWCSHRGPRPRSGGRLLPFFPSFPGSPQGPARPLLSSELSLSLLTTLTSEICLAPGDVTRAHGLHWPGGAEVPFMKRCGAWGLRRAEWCDGSERGSHSLRYFLTGMTDPGPGMPRFVIVGYVDDKIFGIYDSKSRTAQPIVEMLPQEDQEHWAAQTQKAQGGERDFDWFLSRLPERYNKSGGSHTMQMMIGCDILEDGSIRGYDQYAFDGRDFLAFDMDTMTFTAADPVAEITKRRWETEGTYAERWKHELGTVCVQNLRRYLEHGKAAVKRRVQPEVRVWGKEADGILTLSCHAHGFYPRRIAISWMKDSMVQDQETRWGGIVPNRDGTYHTSAAIDVLPEDGDKYRCRVEHASLPQPGLFSWEPQPNLIPIEAWLVVPLVVLFVALIALLVWKFLSG
uniref:Ig-like domain-containing protein n=2 Tax=Gallus gallus TaxID=9031 RepID=A0A8V0X9R8_CHICK